MSQIRVHYQSHQKICCVVLVLFSGFVLLRFENNDQIKFQNFRRFTCYIFIILLISSIFTIPHSISSAYWPDAYAEKPTEFDESASVIPSNATNTEIIEFGESVSVIPGNDTKVKGKPADNEPKGKPADNEPKGKPADNEPKGKPADNEPKGKPDKSDVPAPKFDESVPVIPSNATNTEITEFDESVSVVTSNRTSTEIQEFDESISVIPSNGTSTEIQEFDESISVVPSNSTIIEIPEATISLDFDYDLTKKFTDETYNDSLELDGEKGFLQIYENSTNQV